jgi:hypothetical protein
LGVEKAGESSEELSCNIILWAHPLNKTITLIRIRNIQIDLIIKLLLLKN